MDKGKEPTRGPSGIPKPSASGPLVPVHGQATPSYLHQLAPKHIPDSLIDPQLLQPPVPSVYYGQLTESSAAGSNPHMQRQSEQLRREFSQPESRTKPQTLGPTFADRPVEVACKQAFLPPTRESCFKVGKANARVEYEWKEGPTLPNEEVARIKACMLPDIRKHLHILLTNKFVCSIVRQHAPQVDTSSKMFATLRAYCLNCYRDWKYTMLNKKFYQYVLGLIKQFPNEMNRDLRNPDQKAAFERFLGPRLDIIVFKFIWGDLSKYIDYYKTFGDRTGLPFYFLHTVFFTICVQTIPIVKTEAEMNPGVKWMARLPRATNWRCNKVLRTRCSELYDSMSSYEGFREVNLNIFTWVNRPQPAVPLAVRPPKRRASEDLQGQ